MLIIDGLKLGVVYVGLSSEGRDIDDDEDLVLVLGQLHHVPVNVLGVERVHIGSLLGIGHGRIHQDRGRGCCHHG